jgi:hypothetical protein
VAEPSAEPIPPDFAEAFAYAVLVHEIWTPEEPGRLIQIGSRSYSIIEVCGLVPALAHGSSWPVASDIALPPSVGF